jgi:hypothetical protein
MEKISVWFIIRVHLENCLTRPDVVRMNLEMAKKIAGRKVCVETFFPDPSLAYIVHAGRAKYSLYGGVSAGNKSCEVGLVKRLNQLFEKSC